MLEEASDARLAGSGRPPLSLGPSAGGRPRRAHRRELERLSLLSGTVCTEAHSCASVAANPISSKLQSSLLDIVWRCSNFCQIGTRQPGSALNAPRAPTKMIARVEDVLHVTICSSVLRLFVLPCFLHFFGFLVGGKSIHSTFSRSAAFCALVERGGNRNRVTGKELKFQKMCTIWQCVSKYRHNLSSSKHVCEIPRSAALSFLTRNSVAVSPAFAQCTKRCTRRKVTVNAQPTNAECRK